MLEKQRYLHLSDQVYQINFKEVWNDRLQTNCKLSKDDDSKDVDQRQYKSMIGSLFYVTTSRWDVMQVVG
jgi:hypothetical protein